MLLKYASDSVVAKVRKFTGLSVLRSTRMNQATLHNDFKQLPLSVPAAVILPTAGSLQSGMFCLYKKNARAFHGRTIYVTTSVSDSIHAIGPASGSRYMA